MLIIWSEMLNSAQFSSSPWVPSNLRKMGDAQFTDFVEGLGPAQMVGRQVLGEFSFEISILAAFQFLIKKYSTRLTHIYFS